MIRKLTFPLALVVAAALSAQPALAQQGHGHGHGRSQQEDRGDDGRYDNGRSDDGKYDRGRYENGRSDNGKYENGRYASTRFERRVPPGWCTGRGNPHNTVENCGPGASRYDRRYDSRYNNNGYSYSNSRYGYGTNRTYSSNRQAYDAWKTSHDRQCSYLKRQRPLDLRYQLQVRQQCSAQDRAMRQRYGL